jgi:hypothetical protein
MGNRKRQLLVAMRDCFKIKRLSRQQKTFTKSFGFVFIARDCESRTDWVRGYKPYKLFSACVLGLAAELGYPALVGLI